MTPGNKRLHFEHVRSIKAKRKQYNVNIFGDGLTRNLTTGREIDREVIDSLLHTEEVGNKCFIAFVQDRLVEGKKSFFEPNCRVRLKTGSEKRKKGFKTFISFKGALSSFWFAC